MILKPPMWPIDPGLVWHNCQMMGLPMPVGLWWMPEGSGDKTFDYSGNGINGTLENGATWKNNGISFAAANSRVAVHGIAPIIDLNQDFSVVAAFNKTASATYHDIYNQSNTGDLNTGFGVGLTNVGGIRCQCYKDDDTYMFRQLGIGSGYEDGKDHCVIITKGSSFARYYIDEIDLGSPVAVTPGACTTPDIAYIGIGKNGTSEDFLGIIYFVYVFDVTLAPAQASILSADPYGLVRHPDYWALFGAATQGVGGTTAPPTTLAPTTLAPTTPAPTTVPPTTSPPTTLAPTTLAPTTISPTTLAPTLAPTTLPPTLPPTTVTPTTSLTTAPPPLVRRRGIRNFGFSMRDNWR